MPKPLSDHAAVAAIIRAELKKHAIRASVRSSSFANGDSVRVTILADVLPATRKDIESFCNEYRAGTFDGMTDCYNYSPRVDNSPRTKFVSVDVEYSDAIKQEARAHVEATFATRNDFELDRLTWQTLNGTCTVGGFWNSRKPKICAANLTSYVCKLCGQRIDDGKACGCGAR
jgi:hypothetical protein